MKILFVSDTCPWPPRSGGQIRNARLISELEKRNDVSVVVLDTPPSETVAAVRPVKYVPIQFNTRFEERSVGNWARRYDTFRSLLHSNPMQFRKYQAENIKHAFRQLRSLAEQNDVCWVTWPYVADIAMNAWPNSRIVVDYMDVSAHALSSRAKLLPNGPYKLYSWLESLKLAWYERRVARRSWRSIVCKEEDVDHLRCKNKTYVVPNGTDLPPFSTTNSNAIPRLLFVGLMSYDPNIDAVTWFSRECMPQLSDLQVHLDVIGRDPPPHVRKLEETEGIHIHGFVPNLSDFYAQATVVIAPIRHGSGTKLKVLEALAYGKALIATDEATTGTCLRPDIDFLRANSSSEIVSACRQLLKDADLRHRLGQSGRKCVEMHYTWERIGDLAQKAIEP